ncbi:MAG TPA: VOC family protein [Bacteroidota bacterium]|nr:VOC family protein [Bacteroidota bacterium]
MISINPYFNFAGNTEDAFRFYRSVFGGDFSRLQRFKDTPEGPRVADNERNMLMHVSLPVGKVNTLMATDALASIDQKVVMGNNIHLVIDTESKEEANTLFNGLAAGGTVNVPMADTFWGSYFGMLKDRYGIHWMVSYTPKSKPT